MTQGVYLQVERLIVTLAVLAVFTVLVLTGHMTDQYLSVLSPVLGLIGAAWFSSLQQQQQSVAAYHQAQVQSAPAPVVEIPPTGTAGGAK